MPRIYEDENLFRTLLRNVSRPLHQGLVVGGGLPGSLASLGLNKLKNWIDPEDKLSKGWEARLERENAPQSWRNLPVRAPLPTMDDIEKALMATSGKILPEDFIKGPRNIGEELIDFVGADLPMYAATGGLASPMSFAKAAGKSALTGATMKGAEDMGSGVLGQMGAGTGAGLLYDLLLNKKIGAKSIKEFGKGIQDESAQAAKKAAAGGGGNVAPLVDIVDKMHDEVGNLAVAETKNIKKDLQKFGNQLDTGNLTLEQAWEKKKSFNRLGFGGNMNETERNMYKRLGESLDEWIIQEGGKYPGFVENYVKSKDVTRGLKYQSTLHEALSNTFSPEEIKKSPLKSIIAPIMGVLGSVASGSIKGGAKTLAWGLGAFKGTEYYDMMKNSHVLKKYVGDLIKQSVAGQVQQTGNTLMKINKYLIQQGEDEGVTGEDRFLD